MKLAGAFPPFFTSISKPFFSNQFTTIPNLQKYTKFTDFSLPFAVDQWACGAMHIAMVHEKQVYCWGDNSRGQCGKNPKDTLLLKQPQQCTIPCPIDSVYCGKDFTIALDISKQHLFIWGSNEQVNMNDQYDWKLLYSLQGDETVQQLHCGTHTMLFVTNHQRCYGWGGNHFGQLGTGDMFPLLHPRCVFSQYPVYQVGCGMDQSYLVTQQDQQQQLYSCGRMQRNHYSLPWIRCFDLDSIHHLSVGYQHACVTQSTRDKTLHWWGQGIAQGIPSKQQPHSEIHTHTFDHTIQRLVSGAYHCFVQLVNGDWYGMGLNSDGQLGIDSTQNQKDPIFIMNSDPTDTCHLGFSFSIKVANH